MPNHLLLHSQAGYRVKPGVLKSMWVQQERKRNRVQRTVTESGGSGTATSACVSGSSLRVPRDLAREKTRTNSGASMSARSGSREAAVAAAAACLQQSTVCVSWPGEDGTGFPCPWTSVLVTTDCVRGRAEWRARCLFSDRDEVAGRGKSVSEGFCGIREGHSSTYRMLIRPYTPLVLLCLASCVAVVRRVG